MTLRSLSLCGLLLCSSNLGAQVAHRQELHQPYADLRRYYLGLRVGLHTSDLLLSSTGLSNEQGRRLQALAPEYRPGFSLGVIGGLTLRPGLELRLIPSLLLGDIDLSFGDAEGITEQSTLRSTALQLPLELKWGIRRANTRPFLSLGSYLQSELGGQQADLLRLQPLYAGWSIGLGCDLYFSRFKLVPQLSFSQGWGDALRHKRPELEGDKRMYYTQAIQRAQPRMIQFTLSIE